ncbi:MAG TPA: DNA glycosylase [Methanospirillum sp.]|nr:DNA glycosylase [Methanospirillum sp.]
MQILHLTDRQLPFDLDITLSCGQVFRWMKKENIWTGIVRGRIITISKTGREIWYSGFTREELIHYLALDIEPSLILADIRATITQFTGLESDTVFEKAIRAGGGLRVIRQEPWECLISYICSQNSNIPAIKKRINLIAHQYGRLLGDDLYSFPDPQELAECKSATLRECGSGYRADYILQASTHIAQNPSFLTSLNSLSVPQARRHLLSLHGVGPKVADCILLFAYQQYAVVPVDVWIRTLITTCYPQVKERALGRKECSYNDIAQYCQDLFGSYAGYAQQYLFAARESLMAGSKL